MMSTDDDNTGINRDTDENARVEKTRETRQTLREDRRDSGEGAHQSEELRCREYQVCKNILLTRLRS